MVALATVQATGNLTVVSELASAKFLVEMDKMVQLTLPGSWRSFGRVVGVQVVVSLLWNKTGVSTFTVTSSSPTPLVQNGQSVAFFEAWVGVNGGAPEVLAWQTQCNGATVSGLAADQCAPVQCISAFCGQPVTRCNASSTNSTSPCDVRVYLGWIGPDANNQVCTSSSLLPSNFNLFSSANLISVVTGQVTDFVYGVLNASVRSSLSFGVLVLALMAFASMN